MKSIFKIIIVALTIGLLSCNSDDDEIQKEKIIITGEDFAISIDENPVAGQKIGIVKATSNQGSVIFSITEQIPEDAFTINAETGELTVKNEKPYDFETNPIISGKVKVSNGANFKLLNIKIILNDYQNTDYKSILNENNVWVIGDFYFVEKSELDFNETVYKSYFSGNQIVNNQIYYNRVRRLIHLKNSEVPYGSLNIRNSVQEEEFEALYREDIELEKVYMLDEEFGEVLVYDFSLSLNETAKLWDPSTKEYNSLTVKYVDENYKLHNGETRKLLIFNNDQRIIEGIGLVNKGEKFLYFDNTEFLFDTRNRFVPVNFWEEGKTPIVALSKIFIEGDDVLVKSFLEGDGGHYVENNIIEKGICWSNTSMTPTIDDNYSSNTYNQAFYNVDNLREFYSRIPYTDFEPNKLCYFRSYAKNANGISYSDAIYTLDTSLLNSARTKITSTTYDPSTGYSVYSLKCNIDIKNYPTNLDVLEKGIAVYDVRNGYPGVEDPGSVNHYKVETGTLEEFNSNYYLDTSYDGYGGAKFWTYLKLSNGQVIYGNSVGRI